MDTSGQRYVVKYQYNELNQLVRIQGKDEVIAGYKLKDEAELHYDARGNMLRIQSEGKNIGEYIYDAANRLIRTTTHTGTVAAYAYDGAGRRVKKEIGGDTYDYMVDMTTPYNDVLYVRHENQHGKTALKYLYGNKLFGAKEADESSFYLHDEMGSPIRVMDNEGKSLGVTRYDTFGRPNSYGDVRNDVRGLMSFTGYEDDRDTGLMYVQARYYMPKLGRFVEEDRNKGNGFVQASLNRYVHCYANPLMYVDRDGHEPQRINYDEYEYTPVYVELKNVVESAGGAVKYIEGDTNWLGQPKGNATIEVTFDGKTVTFEQVKDKEAYEAVTDRDDIFYQEKIKVKDEGDWFSHTEYKEYIDIHRLNKAFGYNSIFYYKFICDAIRSDYEAALEYQEMMMRESGNKTFSDGAVEENLDNEGPGEIPSDVLSLMHSLIDSTWGISDNTAEKWFLSTNTAVISKYGLNSTNIGDVTAAVKNAGVSPVLFYAYTVNEGGGQGGFINHYGKSYYANNGGDTAVNAATGDAKYLASQSVNMNGNPAWIDYGNPVDFVPASVKTSGNNDFASMPSGSIGRAYIPATAAATWEVYYPDGLLKSYNKVQNYGAPMEGVLSFIKAMSNY